MATRFVIWLTAVVLTLSWLNAASSSALQLPQVIEQVRSQVDANRALSYVGQVWETDRWYTFPKFQETAEGLQRTMKDIGLHDVELLGAPVDGVTQVGYWTMSLAWDAKSARLEIVEPIVPEEFRVLGDFRQTPTSLGMWSGPTPPEGLIADLVERDKTTDSQNWQGKMILTRENP